MSKEEKDDGMQQEATSQVDTSSTSLDSHQANLKLLEKMNNDLNDMKKKVEIMIKDKAFVPEQGYHNYQVTFQEMQDIFNKAVLESDKAETEGGNPEEVEIKVFQDFMNGKLRDQQLYSSDLVDFFDAVGEYAEKTRKIVDDALAKNIESIEIPDEGNNELEAPPQLTRPKISHSVKGTVKDRIDVIEEAARNDLVAVGGGKKSKRKKSKRKKKKSTKRKKKKYR